MTRRERRNLDLKKKYHYLRNLGYDSKEARKLSQRSFIDTSIIKLKTVNGRTKLVQSKQIKDTSIMVDARMTYFTSRPNNSVYTDWGNLTHNNPYADELMKLAKFISIRDGHEGTDYGYWYLYQLYITGSDDKTLHEEVNMKQSYEHYLKERGKKK